MTTSLITTLNQVQTIIVEGFIPVVYVIGVTSNIFNIILFSGRKLRSNPCSWYFICLCLSQFLLLNVSCLLRMVISWANYTGFSTDSTLCKIRSYFNVLSIVLVRHFICLIPIDRWLITSRNPFLRNKSSINNVRWIILCSFTFWMIFSIHAPIYYTTRSNICIPTSDAGYTLFTTIYNIITSCLPFFLAIIFSILTVFNIRKSARQINPISVPLVSMATNTVRDSSMTRTRVVPMKKRRDMDFIRLMFFQIISYLFFNLVSSFSSILLFISTTMTGRNSERTAIITFIHTLGNNLLYTYVSVTFIFYTLASKIFRQEFILVCKQGYTVIQRCLRCDY